jgi:hypothetical protein
MLFADVHSSRHVESVNRDRLMSRILSSVYLLVAVSFAISRSPWRTLPDKHRLRRSSSVASRHSRTIKLPNYNCIANLRHRKQLVMRDQLPHYRLDFISQLPKPVFKRNGGPHAANYIRKLEDHFSRWNRIQLQHLQES